MSFAPREYGHCYYGWRLEQVSPGVWRERVAELHGPIPDERKLKIARKLLRDGPLLTWCMVFTLSAYLDTLSRWGIDNPLIELAGVKRARALKVLQRPSGFGGLDYTSALMGLRHAVVPRDALVIFPLLEDPVSSLDLRMEASDRLHGIAGKLAGREAPQFVRRVHQLALTATGQEQRSLLQALATQGSPLAHALLQETSLALDNAVLAAPWLTEWLLIAPDAHLAEVRQRLATLAVTGESSWDLRRLNEIIHELGEGNAG